MTHRDDFVGRAISELNDVPAHAPDFFDRLEDSMNAHDKRAGAARKATRAPRRRFRPVAFATAALATAAAVTLAVSLAPDTLNVPDPIASVVTPKVATAAEVSNKVAEALRSTRSIRGIAVLKGDAALSGTPIEARFEFAATDAGDFKMSGENIYPDGQPYTEQFTFNSEKGAELWVSEDAFMNNATLRTGLAAGAPDPTAADWSLQRRLSALARALEGADDRSVTESEVDGRKVWLLDLSFQPNLIEPGTSTDRMQVTVDRETGFPLKVTETSKGRLVFELSFESLTFNEDLSGDFLLTAPDGMSPTPVDHGFRRVALADVAAAVGYTPVLPGWLPEGFELAEVTIAEKAQPTGKEGMNPESRGVVSVAYQRGFERIVVSTRLTGGNAGAWSDPLATGEGVIDTPKLSKQLGAGAFSGSDIEVISDPRGIPHLWGISGDLVFTVAGGLSTDEFVKVAESMATAR